MATGSKSIDPRFDPAFQRGYSQGEQDAHSDAVNAARTVDALRDGAAEAQYSRSQREPRARLVADVGTVSVTGVVDTEAPDLREQQSLTPQSHYVDGAGVLVPIAPTARHKSLARNPWIYVLWALGTSLIAAGGATKMWANSLLYGGRNLSGDIYGAITLTDTFAPIATTAGSFCIVCALLVHSLNWMRKNP